MSKRRIKEKQGIKAIPPKMRIDDIESDITWRVSLEHEGFKMEVSIRTKSGIITLDNTMPWEAFIHGLAHGWEKYFQDNPEATKSLNDFINQQIEKGNYSLPDRG